MNTKSAICATTVFFSSFFRILKSGFTWTVSNTKGFRFTKFVEILHTLQHRFGRNRNQKVFNQRDISYYKILSARKTFSRKCFQYAFLGMLPKGCR